MSITIQEGKTAPVYRVGDVIDVRFHIDQIVDGLPAVRIGTLTVKVFDEPDQIVRHIPAPRPIEVGCRVRHAVISGLWPVRAMFADMVLLEKSDGTAWPAALKHLQRIDDGEAA